MKNAVGICVKCLTIGLKYEIIYCILFSERIDILCILPKSSVLLSLLKNYREFESDFHFTADKLHRKD